MSRPATRATQVTVGELVMKVMKAIRDPGLVALGAAIPSPNCCPRGS